MSRSKPVVTELRGAVRLTRNLIPLPRTMNEAVEVVAHILTQPGWTPESIVRQARKHGFTRTLGGKLTIKAAVRLIK